MAKELLFRITKKDFVVETFRSGGSGGQRRDKTETAVRIRHPASGASAQSSTHAHQDRNKQEAFRRLAATKEFKKWLRVESARQLGLFQDVERAVDEAMKPVNLKVEVHDTKGRWIPMEDQDV